AVLWKPGKLTDEEWVEMRNHVEYGYRMLRHIPFLRDAAMIMLHHHERFDGAGYPQGLKDHDIVIGARIFAIADTYDAMTTDRPYRKALSDQDAREEITRCNGSQFDPAIVEAFFNIAVDHWLQIKEDVAVHFKSYKEVIRPVMS
ncbi:MAG: HD domain-containing phosphohydrolase, partial [Nitrospirota bacterium]|nr:HD domain-containing phosphohydrolase [Nitrospirota bacterium]